MNITERERVEIAEEIGQVRAAIIDQVAAQLLSRKTLQEGEFTTSMFAERHGLEIPQAYNVLKGGLKCGLLTVRKASMGRMVNVWRLAEDGEE